MNRYVWRALVTINQEQVSNTCRLSSLNAEMFSFLLVFVVLLAVLLFKTRWNIRFLISFLLCVF